MPIDRHDAQVLDFSPEHGNETSFVTVPLPCGSRRWHCAWTHPAQEYRAELDLTGKGFRVFLPLHLDRRFERHAGHANVVPLFPGYLFVQFSTAQDQWRRIYRARGIAGLIGEATERPTPVPEGVVEDLLERTSPRRIVDDPGSTAFQSPHHQRAHWQSITSLSAEARNSLLLRLFGRT